MGCCARCLACPLEEDKLAQDEDECYPLPECTTRAISPNSQQIIHAIIDYLEDGICAILEKNAFSVMGKLMQ